jgi:RNA polymerase sigma-70 factor (ECF subfamily)
MVVLEEDVARWLPLAHTGSPEALGNVLEACKAYLLLIARHELTAELQAKAGASDLVQETFLEAQRDFPQFQGQSADELRAWLRQILRNNLANFVRRYRDTGKRNVSAETPLAGESSSANWAAGLAAREETPSQQLIAQEEARAVQAAVVRLPEDYRQVIVLRIQEGRPFEEVGRLMDRSSSAVRKLFARAVERLQQEIETPP